MAVLWSGQRVNALLVSCGAFGAAFLLAAPYTLLDLPGFLNKFGELAKHFANPRPDAFSIYLKHIRQSLAIGGSEWVGASGTAAALLGWTLLWAAGLGLIAAVWRAIGRPTLIATVGFLVFAVMYFRVLTDQSGQIFARYAMPLVPLIVLGLAISTAWASASVARSLRSNVARTLASAAVLALVILPGLVQSIAWDRDNAKISTGRLAYEWMVASIRPSESIVVEDHNFRPPSPRFKSESVDRLINKSLDQYRAEGVAYLIAVSSEYDKFPMKDAPAEHMAYEILFRSTQEVARFEPGPQNSSSPTFRVFRIPR
jgi:hypothetical protein